MLPSNDISILHSSHFEGILCICKKKNVQSPICLQSTAVKLQQFDLKFYKLICNMATFR